MHITSVISAAIALLGAAVMLKWMPGRPAVLVPAQAPPADETDAPAAGLAGTQEAGLPAPVPHQETPGERADEVSRA
jgi:type IV secretory pathway VirJ component